jgi:transcriptional regulator
VARPPTNQDQLGLLQGTLDMLILQTLRPGPAHGHQIATTIEQTSDHALQVDHGSLYPALHRLIKRGWITGTWGVSANNRRARFYALTETGRGQLLREATKWERMVEAVGRVMRPAGAGEAPQ